jgi:transposase
VSAIAETYAREVRDLAWSEYRTTGVVELYRPRCGVKAEKVPLLPGKAGVPSDRSSSLGWKAAFSKRFEDAVGEACQSAAARRVARQVELLTNAVRAIDLRYLDRWSESRKKPASRNMGVDQIHLGKKQKFITVVSNLDVAEPPWFGQGRKKDTLDEFLEKRLSPFQRGAIQAASTPPRKVRAVGTPACVDMWEPFRQSIEQWPPKAL